MLRSNIATHVFYFLIPTQFSIPKRGHNTFDITNTCLRDSESRSPKRSFSIEKTRVLGHSADGAVKSRVGESIRKAFGVKRIKRVFSLILFPKETTGYGRVSPRFMHLQPPYQTGQKRLHIIRYKIGKKPANSQFSSEIDKSPGVKDHIMTTTKLSSARYKKLTSAIAAALADLKASSGRSLRELWGHAKVLKVLSKLLMAQTHQIDHFLSQKPRFVVCSTRQLSRRLRGDPDRCGDRHAEQA